MRSFAAAGIGFWVPGLMLPMGVSWRVRQVCCFLLVVFVGTGAVAFETLDFDPACLLLSCLRP